jgi:hypothetical protein
MLLSAVYIFLQNKGSNPIKLDEAAIDLNIQLYPFLTISLSL